LHTLQEVIQQHHLLATLPEVIQQHILISPHELLSFLSLFFLLVQKSGSISEGGKNASTRSEGVFHY
jgi:hypothetical protein